MFGEGAYPDRWTTAALLHSLAHNHALGDGNKRAAWAVCRVFRLVHGTPLRAPVEDAVPLVVAVTTGELDDVEKIAARLRALSG